jgi:hypothetical protein
MLPLDYVCMYVRRTTDIDRTALCTYIPGHVTNKMCKCPIKINSTNQSFVCMNPNGGSNPYNIV